MLNSFKQKISIKYFMLFYLGLLLLYSSWNVRKLNILIGLLILAIYAISDVLWTRRHNKIWYFPLSSLISGCILSLVALPFNNLALAALLPVLAVLGKQLLHFGKLRHVFNPASFAMAVVSLSTPIISWWGVAWGKPVFWIVLLAGVFILWRQNAWHKALSFLAAYAIVLAIISPKLFDLQIFDGRLLFFATVMLIEPITSTFSTKKREVFYGVSVGIFAAVFLYFKIDSLIIGLLSGNLLSSLLFL